MSPKVNGSSVDSPVTVRNLRERDIYSNPLISKLYSPEIWHTTDCPKARQYSSFRLIGTQFKAATPAIFDHLVKQRVDSSPPKLLDWRPRRDLNPRLRRERALIYWIAL